jgi:hypothetical protein
MTVLVKRSAFKRPSRAPQIGITEQVTEQVTEQAIKPGGSPAIGLHSRS